MEIHDLEYDHCRTCQIIKEWRAEGPDAQMKCISRCDIGKRIHECGKALGVTQKQKIEEILPKDKLTFLLDNGATTRQIASLYNIATSSVSILKNKYGLTVKRK